MSKTESKNIKKALYTKDDLPYFEKLIMDKRKEAANEIERLRGRIASDNHADLDNDSDYSFHLADSASVAADREHVYRMIDRQERFIMYLDRAMERIKNKTYGICRVTGKAIAKERLEAIPHTQLSMEGKMQEKRAGRIIPGPDDLIM
ncbi:TraR/DksA C4-type zinc finger protein [bacterium]|nr:TraR/DksA C4-type zinc finger protein [bacterium]